MADWQSMAPWALTAIVMTLLGIQTVLNRRRIQRLEARFRDSFETFGRELHATSSGSMGVGQRVIACERGVHELRRAMEEMRQNDPLRVSYDEASRLVDLGANVDELMNNCGISRPEAELVSALRKRQVA
ncbi:MAG: hypothetical protein CL581_00250 [Alteromonadaceae bacterium]|uniref:DUF2802 domain-containing protein n=1 Tax=unclassified Marinobacter TaxID=83889 RepID=UPI000C5D97A8|nr:DUF2802 domain-containing protein [Marinobacter sp. BGYM27]MAA63198.1 hypothetical protein [Alteromonadaceae bacterium]MBH84188.1 hypothetical protein [Alteromonadaceae bacterium]MDG5498620.1 DUF2802 domain-containing protein [Marinobacter sp. BGYM27]|tara:strand:+ start:21062 stop:21451 length:390 start_codon:yes stop_codon:yes gene_type:complete